MDISTKDVDLDQILARLEKAKETSPKTENKSTWRFPVRGTAHLMWDSLKLRGFTWQPFQGEMSTSVLILLLATALFLFYRSKPWTFLNVRHVMVLALLIGCYLFFFHGAVWLGAKDALLTNIR